MISTAERLVKKSIEVFLLAIEIYNKPTIHYRVEGFALFIINAWELMLKAHLIKRDGEQAIYFKDKPNRTISVENCIRKVFTNDRDPLVINLIKLIELRNLSTHFITEEYESIYTPLFQANILNFENKIKLFHGIDISDYIPKNFLTLSPTLNALDETKIRGKYSDEIASRLLDASTKINKLASENGDRFAIRIEHFYYQTKNKNEATEKFILDTDSNLEHVRIIKEVQDPNKTHKYSASDCINNINKLITRSKIKLFFKSNEVLFNKFHFNALVKYFDLKNKPDFCFKYTRNSKKDSTYYQYTYSQKTIDFLFDELKKDPKNLLTNTIRQKQ